MSEIDCGDIVSVRVNNFGAEVMLCDRENSVCKYRQFPVDPASLDDIMLYYVHKEEREWQ